MKELYVIRYRSIYNEVREYVARDLKEIADALASNPYNKDFRIVGVSKIL